MEKHSLKIAAKVKAVKIDLPTSKSESNRLLIMQALANNAFPILKLSTAEDTLLLQAALSTKEKVIDVGMAGTAFRFLTAYFSAQKGRKTILTGAERMKKRPIGILVDALRQLGADITYLETAGFPPLEIQGKDLKGGKLSIDGSVSSQFVSALLLIAPNLSSPLTIEMNTLVSKPYVDLTMELMKKLNAKVQMSKNSIQIEASSYHAEQAVEVEADWSSAAFFYQIMAFSSLSSIELPGLKKDSFQGDKRLAELYKAFGVETVFKADTVQLHKNDQLQKEFQVDLSDCPDLIPSVAVTAAVLCENVLIKGVQTLRIKESDRVEALKLELKQIGVELIEISDHSVQIQGKAEIDNSEKLTFSTYNDHRMAMCLAPLIFCFEEIEIENPSVVLKSFPHFWEELKKCGVQFT